MLSLASPSGLTSNVIVEEVDSPCLVVGTNVTLRCQPDGVPRSQVTWFRNVQLLSSNSKYRISEYPDFTLTIIDVVSSDKGSYTCTAENTLTNGTASGTIAETFYMFTTTCGEFAVNVHTRLSVHVAVNHVCHLHTRAHRHTHTHTHTHTHRQHTHTHTQRERGREKQSHNCTQYMLLCTY